MATDINIKSLVELVKQFSYQATREMKNILRKKGKGNSNIINILQYFSVKSVGGNIQIESRLPSYAYWVDQGRKPGKQPPLRVIVEWCKRKKIDTRLAFPIAKKIGEEGLPATNFTAPMKDLNGLIKLMQEEFGKIVINEINSITQTITKSSNN